MTRSTVLRTMRHYLGKVRTLRNEIRTERMLNSLPAHLRTDIGWPDDYEGRRGRGR